MDKYIVISSPIKSVCICPNTPGSNVPSHGTDKYGERYAIDFVVLRNEGVSKKPYNASLIKYLFQGLPLENFYGWGEKIYTPICGEVIKVIDGIKERNPANIFFDLKYMFEVTKGFENGKDDYRHVTGNCVIIKVDNEVFLLLAHLKNGSIMVKEGQKVKEQELIGELGHSGNSTMPHLHMQLMDNPDFLKAKGLPFVMQEYFVKTNHGKWLKVTNSIPKKDEIVKF